MKRTTLFSKFRTVIAVALISLLPLQVQALTIGEERLIGERLLYSVRGAFPILDDPDIHQYINRLGRDVLKLTGPRNFEYHFFVVLSPQFNAFAAPGGLVFFYTGLIENMKTEDELLAVLAHEIGHVVSRHIAQRIEQSSKITAASMAVGLAGLALGIPALSQGILAGSLAAGQSLQLEFSRNDEEQADRLSYEWMQKMGRNPEAMESMLRTMRRITRYRSGKLPQYLLTHPDPEARLDYVQALLAMDGLTEDGKGERPPKRDDFAFQRFKYRVLEQSVEAEKLRVFCANNIASGRSEEQRTMGYYGMSLLAAAERDTEGALRNLAEVKARYPDEYILDIDEAVIYADNGQEKKAKEMLRKVITRHPEDMYVVYELAKIEHKEGGLERAGQLYHQVRRTMPHYGRLYYDLGRLNADLGRENVSRFYLGKYYLYQGRLKSARQYLDRSAKDEALPAELRSEAEDILKRLKKIEKET